MPLLVRSTSTREMTKCRDHALLPARDRAGSDPHLFTGRCTFRDSGTGRGSPERIAVVDGGSPGLRVTREFHRCLVAGDVPRHHRGCLHKTPQGSRAEPSLPACPSLTEPCGFEPIRFHSRKIPAVPCRRRWTGRPSSRHSGLKLTEGTFHNCPSANRGHPTAPTRFSATWSAGPTCRAMSAIGGRAADICSMRVLRILTVQRG